MNIANVLMDTELRDIQACLLEATCLNDIVPLNERMMTLITEHGIEAVNRACSLLGNELKDMT